MTFNYSFSSLLYHNFVRIAIYFLIFFLELFSNLDSKISDAEDKIRQLIKDINPPLLSIKGIGELSAAVIIAEYGDISRFSSPHKMLAFAGLEPGFSQSGTAEHNGKMVKKMAK